MSHCTREDIAKLFQWFKARGLIMTGPQVSEEAYFRECQMLTTIELRIGCRAVERAEYRVVPLPDTFYAMANGSYKPLSPEEHKAAIERTRRAIAEAPALERRQREDWF